MFATTFLFLISLILKSLSQTKTNIPLPRCVNNAIIYIDEKIPKLLKIQKNNNELQQEHKEDGTTEFFHKSDNYYTIMSYSLNHIIFSLFFLIYSFFIIICLVF